MREDYNFLNYLIAMTPFFIALEQKWFAWSWLSYIGKISYCIYLFHNPILWALQPWISNSMLLLFLVLLLTILLSAFFHHTVEVPCIALGKKFVKSRDERYPVNLTNFDRT